MDREEFEKILDSTIQEAAQWQEQHLAAERKRNYEYYLGQMDSGPEGRSSIVSWDVFETIESALPDLIEIFLSGDNIAEYEPVGPEDEEFAEQATDYINYIVQKQNPGFLIFNTWIKDALLSKLGIVRAYWAVDEKVEDKTYRGLSALQLTQLIDDPEIEILSQDAYDDPADAQARIEVSQGVNVLAPEEREQAIAYLQSPIAQVFDVTIRRTRKKGRTYIDNVQPENFVITPRAKTIADADIVGELKMLTRSDMLELGYKKSDVAEVQSLEVAVSEEGGINQIADDDPTAYNRSPDDSTEEIKVFDGFIRLDYEGSGIARWRKVVRAGNVTLLNEEGEPDFVAMTPIPIPHRLTGLALADVVAPIQQSSTAMQRQYIDSLFLANNPRTYVNTEAGVNMADLLNTRIGGIVRGKAPVANAISPLVTSNVAQSALEGIEFMDSRKELRTGITRYNQGLDADTLNKTATGITKIMGAGDARKRMMARIMAETGIKDLFRLLLKIVVDNQDQAEVIRLRNHWVPFDPSPWPAEMDVTIETGRGSGDKSELLVTLNAILEAQKEALANGLPIVDLKKIYNTLESMLKATGLKSVDKYFNDPDQMPPQEPQQQESNPEVALAQATIEAEKIRAEAKMKQIEADMIMKDKDLEIRKMELQIKAAELELKRAEAAISAQNEAREQDRKDREISFQG